MLVILSKNGGEIMVKNYVLDTNILIHDPKAIFNFQDNNVIIPFPVLEEIDSLKTRNNNAAAAAREINRILDRMREIGSIKDGIKLENGGFLKIMTIEKDSNGKIPRYLGNSKDDFILFYAMYLNMHDDKQTIIVSKDLNLRVKADAVGITAQDYLSDKTNLKTLSDGYIIIENNEIDSSKDSYSPEEIGINKEDVFPNLYLDLNDNYFRFSLKENLFKRIEMNYLKNITGIKPRNVEQIFAFDALLSTDIPLISLVGTAGTGKTLLALAAGLEATIEMKIYQKLLVSKPVIPMGKDIGYLPGSLEEKMRPWLQPIYDNLEFLSEGKGRKIEQYLDKNDLLEIEVLSYIRGRSIPNQYMIIDESQNLTPSEIKTILTRVGENTKIVLTGDPYQIDSPYLDTGSNGLVYAASRFASNELAAHIVMKKGERSNLASIAAKIL